MKIFKFKNILKTLMRSTIKSQEEYDNIVNIFIGKDTTVDVSKHTKYCLKNKSELFILKIQKMVINGCL